MKIINITNGAFAALLLASSVAGAESQYPASDFQPKVVYQDPDYKHQSSSTPAPAAASSAKKVDSQYPAADFQPKVVYSDSEYKHSSAAPSAPAASASSSSATEASAPAAKKEDSNFIYLIGLAVLGFVGFVFFKKQAQPEGHAAPAASRSAAGGATGVAKYLNRKAGTGVSRYLEQQVKSVAASGPLTGVAKYMASKSADNKSSDKPASRVEQYLRNRG